MLYAIFAVDSSFGFAKDGKIPWRCPEDMEFFKRTTSGATVVMGTKTWDSLPKKPLPNRRNIILSTRHKNIIHEDMHFTEYFEYNKEDLGSMYVIGGLQVFDYVFKNYTFDCIYMTVVDGNYECDLFFDKNLISGYDKQILHRFSNASVYCLTPIQK